jgi:hypothetical protein
MELKDPNPALINSGVPKGRLRPHGHTSDMITLAPMSIDLDQGGFSSENYSR